METFSSQQTGSSSIQFHSIASGEIKEQLDRLPLPLLPVFLVHGGEASCCTAPMHTSWGKQPCATVKDAPSENPTWVRGPEVATEELAPVSMRPDHLKNNNSLWSLVVKSELINQNGTCPGTLKLQLLIALNHYRGALAQFCPVPTGSLPKISQAESGRWNKPMTAPEEQLLILCHFLLQSTVMNEFMHLGNRSNSPTFWRECFCVASLSLSKILCKTFWLRFFDTASRETGEKKVSRFTLINVFPFAGP